MPVHLAVFRSPRFRLIALCSPAAATLVAVIGAFGCTGDGRSTADSAAMVAPRAGGQPAGSRFAETSFAGLTESSDARLFTYRGGIPVDAASVHSEPQATSRRSTLREMAGRHTPGAAARLDDPLGRLIALATLERAVDAPAADSAGARAAADQRPVAGTPILELSSIPAEGSPTYTWTSDSLESIVGRIVDEHSRPAAVSVKEADEQAWRQAMRLFLEGRDLRLSGQPQQALPLLAEAARLNRASVAISSELARTRAALGQHDDATLAWRQVLAIDPDHREALLRTGIHAAERGRTEAAIAAFAQAAGLPSFWKLSETAVAESSAGGGADGTDGADSADDRLERSGEPTATTATDQASPRDARNVAPLLVEAMQEPIQIVALAELAAVLERVRADRAAIEALETLTPLARGDLALSSGPITDDVERLVQHRGDLDRRLGDAWYRLGEYERAADAWSRAIQEPMIDSESIITRLTIVERRLARPATAALTALRSLPEVHQTERVVAMIADLARREHGSLLASAVNMVADSEPESLALTAAAAAVSEPEEGLARWSAYLERHPHDHAAWEKALRWGLLRGDTDDGDDDVEGARLAIRLLLQHPGVVQQGGARIVGTLADLAGDPQRLQRALAVESVGLRRAPADRGRGKPVDSPAFAAELLNVYLTLLTRQPAAALASANRLARTWPDRVEVTLARITALGELDRAEEARRLLDRMLRTQGASILAEPSLTYQVAHVLTEFGEPESALAWLTRLEQAVLGDSTAPPHRSSDTDLVDPDGQANADSNSPPAAESETDSTVTVQGFDPITHARRKAQLAISINRPESAENILLQTLAHYPESEPIYQALLTLYSASGVQANEERRNDLRRLLDRYLPSSRVRRLLNAQNEVQRGRPRSAATVLTRLAEEDPADSVAATAAAGQWIRADEADFALNWLEERLIDRPGDLSLKLSRIDALIALSAFERALAAANDLESQFPQEASVLQRTQTSLEGLGRTEEAATVARQIVELDPPSIERQIRLAAMAIDMDDPTGAIGDLQTARAIGGPTFYANLDLILSIARAAAEAGTLPDTTAESHHFIEAVVLDAMDAPESPPVSAAAGLMLIDAMLQLDRPIETILDAVDKVRSVHPDRSAEVTALVVSGLAEYQRTDDAVDVVDAWLTLPTELTLARRDPGQESVLLDSARTLTDIDLEMIRWRLLQAARRDEPRLVIGLVSELSRLNHLNVLEFTPITPTDPDSAESDVVDRDDDQAVPQTAESVLYMLSQVFDQAGHDAGAELLLRAVLTRDPEHAMAANNLGYRFVERGERLAEAEQLLRMAVRQRPDSPAVLDSLGWLRYRLGQFERPGFDGRLSRLDEWGAIALLQRAVDLDTSTTTSDESSRTSATPDPGTDQGIDLAGAGDPVILDHLADALWQAGRKDEAAEIWQRIVDTRNRLVAEAMLRSPPSLATIDALWAEPATVAASKLQAVAEGTEPNVAPLALDPRSGGGSTVSASRSRSSGAPGAGDNEDR